jgi:hypothetical protein
MVQLGCMRGNTVQQRGVSGASKGVQMAVK